MKMDLVSDDIDGVKFEKYECPKCGESMTTDAQLNEMTRKYKEKKEKTFEVATNEWGGERRDKDTSRAYGKIQYNFWEEVEIA